MSARGTTQDAVWLAAVVGRLDAAVGGPPLRARSTAEAHVYMDMRGVMPERTEGSEQTKHGMITTFTAYAEEGDQPIRFAFQIADPAGKLGKDGPPSPSTIIGPAEFALWADILSKRTPGSTDDLSPERAARASKEISVAAACTEELIKFIPSGSRGLAASAFPGEAARRLYDHRPWRFEREMLAAVAKAYRECDDRKPEQVPVAAEKPATPVPAAKAAAGNLSLRSMLQALSERIDAERTGAGQRIREAMAVLAASMTAARADEVQPSELAWFMTYGESFLRWQCFAAGQHYWQAILGRVERLGLTTTAAGPRAAAWASAHALLAGEVTTDAATTREIVEFVAAVHREDHPLTRMLRTRCGEPVRPARDEALAGLDATTRLALWVTLAFYDLARADGTLAAREYVAWKQSLARMDLPDVRERFPQAALDTMLRDGALYRLSAEVTGLSLERRTALAHVLSHIVNADGQIDPREFTALQRICGWIGLSIVGS